MAERPRTTMLSWHGGDRLDSGGVVCGILLSPICGPKEWRLGSNSQSGGTLWCWRDKWRHKHPALVYETWIDSLVLGLENLSVEWVMDYSSQTQVVATTTPRWFWICLLFGHRHWLWLQIVPQCSTVGFNAIWPSNIPPSSIEPRCLIFYTAVPFLSFFDYWKMEFLQESKPINQRYLNNHIELPRNLKATGHHPL